MRRSRGGRMMNAPSIVDGAAGTGRPALPSSVSRLPRRPTGIGAGHAKHGEETAMYPVDPYTLGMLAQDRQREILRDVERQRLLKLARAGRDESRLSRRARRSTGM